MNRSSYTYYQLFLFGFLVLWGTNLQAQVVRQVDFYYVSGGQMHKGSVKIQFELYNGIAREPMPSVVKYDDYDYRKISIRSRIMDVEYPYAKHNGMFQILFPEELGVEINGVVPRFTSDEYVTTTHPGRRYFGFGPLDDISGGGAAFIFLITRSGFQTSGMTEADFVNGNIVGMGFFVEPLVLVPEGYVEEAEGTIELLDLLWKAKSEESNSEFIQLSSDIAEAIREQQFEELKKYIGEDGKSVIRNRNSGSGSGTAEYKAYDLESSTPDPDQEAFSAAIRQGNRSAYRQYVADFPNGRHVSTAQNKITELTPFQLSRSESIEGVYAIHEFEFIEGVGNQRPTLTVSNNGSFSIKHKWKNRNLAVVRIPEGRNTELNFTLGRKDTLISISHKSNALTANLDYQLQEISISQVSGGQAPYQVEILKEGNPVYTHGIEEGESEMKLTLEADFQIDTGQFVVRVYDQADQEYVKAFYFQKGGRAYSGRSSGKSLLAFLLAIPFMCAIGYLLYKQYYEPL